MAETLEKLVKRVNGNGGTSNIKELGENHLLNILTKEINRNEVFKRLQESKQEKIKIKEIVLESEIDFTPSLKKFQEEQIKLTANQNNGEEKDHLTLNNIQNEIDFIINQNN